MEKARIAQLPVREDYPPNLVELMTAAFKMPGGTMKLLPLQAEACYDMVNYGACFGALAVGGGKTLTAQLAPTIFQAKRPLLLVRAALLPQMTRDYVKHQKHWILHKNIQMLTYHDLSRQHSTAFLYRYQPDLIVADEAHKISREEAGRTLKVWDYFMANPDCKFVPLSGTMTNKQIKEYWRLLVLALDERAPIPFHDDMLMSAVSSVIDVSGRSYPTPKQFAITGDLYNVPHEDTTRWGKESLQTKMRRAYQQRLRDTPGVVISKDNRLGTGLELYGWQPKMPQPIKEAIDLMSNFAIAPNGEAVENHLEVYQWERQILSGFYYEFVWPNGKKDHKWLKARSAWTHQASELVGKDFRYTESEIRAWYEAHKPDDEIYKEWCLVESLKAPPPRAVTWLDESIVDQALDKLYEQKEGILWFEHNAVGDLLRKKGIRVYDEGDSDIDQEASPAHFAASMGAHSEGRNLQRYWYNVVLSPPPSGKAWEQLLGRTHRFGQKKDVVEFHVACYHEALTKAMKTAVKQSLYVEESIGTMQRLTKATWIDLEKE